MTFSKHIFEQLRETGHGHACIMLFHRLFSFGILKILELISRTGMTFVTSKYVVSIRNSFSASKPIAIRFSQGVQSPPLDSDLSCHI